MAFLDENGLSRYHGKLKSYIDEKGAGAEVLTQAEYDAKPGTGSDDKIYVLSDVNSPAIAIDTEMSETSINPVQNKVITAALKNAGSGTITGIKMNGETKGTSGVVDLGTVVTDVSGKQDKLTAGNNVTISGNTISATNTWRGIQNNLTSTSTTDSLSAAQGKALNDKIGSTSISGIGNGTITGAISTLNSNMVSKEYYDLTFNGGMSSASLNTDKNKVFFRKLYELHNANKIIYTTASTEEGGDQSTCTAITILPFGDSTVITSGTGDPYHYMIEMYFGNGYITVYTYKNLTDDISKGFTYYYSSNNFTNISGASNEEIWFSKILAI